MEFSHYLKFSVSFHYLVLTKLTLWLVDHMLVKLTLWLAVITPGCFVFTNTPNISGVSNLDL